MNRFPGQRRPLSLIAHLVVKMYYVSYFDIIAEVIVSYFDIIAEVKLSFKFA